MREAKVNARLINVMIVTLTQKYQSWCFIGCSGPCAGGPGLSNSNGWRVPLHLPGDKKTRTRWKKKLARLKNTCQVIKKKHVPCGEKTFQVKKHLSGELIQYWSFKNWMHHLTDTYQYSWRGGEIRVQPSQFLREFTNFPLLDWFEIKSLFAGERLEGSLGWKPSSVSCPRASKERWKKAKQGKT